VLSRSFDDVLGFLVLAAAVGLALQGIWILVTRRAPRPLFRRKGEAVAPQPVRIGGFRLLFGTGILVSRTGDVLTLPRGLHLAVLLTAVAALLASISWYAWRRD
jgi:hypothetical protein